MDYKSISAGELASQIDVQRSNISHILNGRNKPGASFIEKLLVSYPDLNARWLMTGEGDMTEEVLDIASPVVCIEAEATESKPSDIRKEIPGSIATDRDKSIEKVVVLFADGTFVNYNKR